METPCKLFESVVAVVDAVETLPDLEQAMISLQRLAENGLFCNKGLKIIFLRYCLIFN